MHQPQVSCAEPDVDRRTVAQPRRQKRLKEQTEVHGGVPHALGADREPPGLTDDQIGPLHHDDSHKEGRLRVRERLFLDHAVCDVLALRVSIVPAAALTELALGADSGLASFRVDGLAVERALVLAVHHVFYGHVVEPLAALLYRVLIFVGVGVVYGKNM